MGLNTSSSSLRIGLFGGAFDPPHLAHRALAESALHDLQLDWLYVVPTGQAWHKSRTLTDAHHRWAMTRLAFEGLSQVVIEPRELNHAGPSYTVDTLAALRTAHPSAQFFLIMGADQAVMFNTWRDWTQIAEWATLAVGERALDGQSQATQLEWHNPAQTKLVRLRMPLMPISATEIRQQLQQARNSATTLSPSVIQYIQQHHLYTDPHD